VLSARNDRNHIPRIPVPIRNRRLLPFALSDRLDFKSESVTGRPGAGDVEFFGAVAAADYCATFLGAEAARLYKSVGVQPPGIRHGSGLTVSHRWGLITLIPSTNRNFVVSLNVSSGINTEQITCTHPCPSVGFCARKNVSGGG
jgi:hypothetical protein